MFVTVSPGGEEPPRMLELDAFDRELALAHLRGQWQIDRMLQRATSGPTPAGVPFLWPWQAVRANLERACVVMPESRTARRNLSFVNPGLERGKGVTTHTITAGMQMVKAGETAEAHRHTIAALRFAIEGGERVFTVVDGRAYPMERYDLVFTPAWSWHDHHNETDAPAIWLDVLDSPLVVALNQVFFEPHPQGTQAVQEHGDGTRRFSWRAMEAMLQAKRDQTASPYDGVVVHYLDPATGRSPLRALGCRVQMLRPGEETRPHRHTSSCVHFVIRGEGLTVAGDTEVRWTQHDTFAVPNWIEHRHVNASRVDEAILFTVDDAPLLESLGLHREEPEQSRAAAGQVQR